MTEDEYFEMLEKRIDKYEYWNGIAVAMAGAQPDHVSIGLISLASCSSNFAGETAACGIPIRP